MISQQDELEQARINLGNPFELFAKLVNGYDGFIGPGIFGKKPFGVARPEARKWLLAQEYLDRLFSKDPMSLAIPPDVLASSQDIANILADLVRCNSAEEFSIASDNDYLDRRVAEFDLRLHENPDYEKCRVRGAA